MTLKVNVVAGVPLPGETLPAVRLTWPHVADTASVGAVHNKTDAPEHIVEHQRAHETRSEPVSMWSSQGSLRVLGRG